MIKFKLISLGLVLGLLLTACGATQQSSSPTSNTTQNSNEGGPSPSETAAPAETVVVQMADHFPTNHFMHNAVLQFQDRVIELTNGQVEFEYYPAGTLVPINDVAGAVRDGSVEFGLAHITTSGFMHLSTVMSLPTKSTTVSDNGKVLEELVNGALKEELDKLNMVPIFGFNAHNSLSTKGKKVVAPEDMAGLKIRGSGGILTKLPEYFGGSGVSVSNNELYEALQKGVVEGTFTAAASVIQYHFDEVTDYTLSGVNFGSPPFAYVMNAEKWNSLPKNVRDAFLEAGKEATALAGKLFDEESAKALETIVANGNEVIELSPEESAEFIEKMEPVYEAWVEDVVGKGIDREEAQKVLDAYLSAVDEVIHK